jgi:hypothetical protein
MTEAEWLAGTDIDAMIGWAGPHASERHLVLACCAQCRRLGSLLAPRLAEVLNARERQAHPPVTADLGTVRADIDNERDRTHRQRERASRDTHEAMRAAREECNPDRITYPTAPLFRGAEELKASQAQEDATAAMGAVEAIEVVVFGPETGMAALSRLRTISDQVAEHQAMAFALAELAANWERRADELAEQFGRYPRKKRQIAAEAQQWVERGENMLVGINERKAREAATRSRKAFARTLHDIVGNPFRPVAFDPRWKTADVVALARGIYEERAFERMPLLADALMDAGCADERVIAHCREPGAHYRGCWVVDAVLDLERPPGP